ncbi:MAG: general secretion pathway protein GspD [Cyanobacteria bacterium SBLK]|nr:general secretion pathway protein GspD [Cyanobacteria bacterium SBLK]
MRTYQQPLGILTGAAAIVLVVATTASAAEVQITRAKLQTAESQLRLILETAGSGSAPPVVLVPKSGNRLEATISNSRLYLEDGSERVRQDNPIPGIAAIEMWQGASNTVFISVMGSDRQPEGGILQQEPGEVIFGFAAGNPEYLGLQRQSNSVSNSVSEPVLERPVSESPVLERSDILPPNTVLPPQNLPPQTLAQQPRPLSSPYFREQFSQESPVAANSPQTATPATTAIAPPAANPQPSYPSYDANTFRELLAQGATPIIPNAQIVPEGNPAPLAQPSQPIVPVPPLLPQPVPPPVSPQAVANVNISQQILDLGTAARVPRIVLQEAPAREVLSLLARSADLNLIFADDGAGGDSEGGERRISLDLQDEPVQDVFNYVIQATGLEATRKGRTIFVGTQLPITAKDVISRTFRVNQVSATEAAAFLTTLGAELQQQTTTTTVNRTTVDAGLDTAIEGADTEIGTLATTTQIQLTTLSAGDDANGPLPLRGLTVSPDSRLNQVTIVGEPRLIQMAGSYLSQLDARVRQVAVNVKVIDVDLDNDARYGASFSWGIGDTGIINNNGIGIINFGTDDTNIPPYLNAEDVPDSVQALDQNYQIDRGQRAPSSAGSFSAIGSTIATTTSPQLTGGNFDIVEAFLAQIQFSIQNNQAKILTDPTLVVQEGQTAAVNLTEEVVGNVTTDIQVTDGSTITTTTIDKEPVGLVLQVLVNRIDDNGFITMGINPVITSIGSTAITPGGSSIALINQRSLASGQIRMRDGQTLILSGIILDQDRISTQKIPLLGDIPIIGSLFRRSFRQNQRAEVIVIVTPRILDDSQYSNFGYTYVPSHDARRLMEEQGFPALPPQ